MRYLVLTFQTMGGEKINIQLPNPRRDITPDELKTIGQTIIQSQVFSKAGNVATALTKAYIVTREIQEFIG